MEIGGNNKYILLHSKFSSVSNFSSSYRPDSFTTRTQLTRTLQGSVLSSLLFISYLLYADDLVLFTLGRNIQDVQKLVQRTTNRLAIWGNRHGLYFALFKTKMVNFTKKHNLPTVHLSLSGVMLTQTSNTKFLGLTFDRTLTSISIHVVILSFLMYIFV